MKKTKETTISSFAFRLPFSRINLIAIFNSISLLVLTLTLISIEKYYQSDYFLSPVYAGKTESTTEGPTIGY